MQAPNLVVTPHLGASTVESQRKVGMQIAEQIADALDHGVFREALNIPVRDWATFAKLQPQLQLAERMGMLAQQFVEGGIKRVEVEYQGEPFEEIPAINNSLLKGFLLPFPNPRPAVLSLPTLVRPAIRDTRGLTTTDSSDLGVGLLKGLSKQIHCQKAICCGSPVQTSLTLDYDAYASV